MLLATTFIAAFMPPALATPIEITSIDPDSGPVGTIVRVIGEIDTLGGFYEIWWDWESLLKEGNCLTDSKEVNDTFTVPSSSEGVHDVVLFDITSYTESAPVQFVLVFYTLSIEPTRIQEGLNTTITVGVQGAEANKNYTLTTVVTTPTTESYTANLTVTTDEVGFGNVSKIYWGEFPGANTHFVGTYSVTVNETLATENFTVGLTDELIYEMAETVDIRGSGYNANETVTVDIKFGEASVAGYPKNITADAGVVTDSWDIPINATTGIYIVTLIGATTLKEPTDVQEFSIRLICQIQTKKLDEEVLAGVEVWVYNATMWAVNASLTDEEGLAEFWLESGNYTFEAYWGEPGRRILVGILVNVSITKNDILELLCWIARLRIAISPPLPFIDITLTYQNVAKPYLTNSTGIWEIPGYMPTNISYTIEARRYGLPFYNETLEKLPAAMNVSWVNITITCPTYTMFVHVLDSKGLPLQNVEVAAYEWSSGVAQPVQSNTTNLFGSATLRCRFGKYKIWVYSQNRTVILNKTFADLIEDRLFLMIHCKISNVDLSVVVKDYFGNPIPNALVKVEREGVDALEQKTGSKGMAPFNSITGGDCRISVSVMGKLCETRTLYIDGTKLVVFKLENYIVVGGYPLETTQLITGISLGILVASLVLALIYRRLRSRKVSEEKEKSL